MIKCPKCGSTEIDVEINVPVVFSLSDGEITELITEADTIIQIAKDTMIDSKYIKQYVQSFSCPDCGEMFDPRDGDC